MKGRLGHTFGFRTCSGGGESPHRKLWRGDPLVLLAAKHAYPDGKLYAFPRSEGERAFAMELGATGAGAIEPDPGEAGRRENEFHRWKIHVDNRNSGNYPRHAQQGALADVLPPVLN